MKKSEILTAYNALLPELESVTAHYKATTGQDYPGLDYGIFRQLHPNNVSWGKFYLEDLLNKRERIIRNCVEDETIFINNKRFKDTEGGKSFIFDLEVKRLNFFKELNQISNTFYKEFDELLATVGLPEWKMLVRPTQEDQYPRYIPSTRNIYFDIQHSEMMYASLHVEIGKERNGRWTMVVSSSMHTRTGDIFARDEQFHQYKAYVTICEHALVFQTWMESKYQEMAHKCYDLLDEIDKVDNDLKDPYTAWKNNQ